MVDTLISIRTARDGDEVSIADVHDAAWRDAYQGVIPGRELERMIARRGPMWWRNAIARGSRLLVLDFGDKLAGYVSYGRNRVPALTYSGEIFELYLAPEYQGGGFGRRCSRLRKKILPIMVIVRFSSGPWPTTSALWRFTAGWAGASCGAPMKNSARKRASESRSVLSDARRICGLARRNVAPSAPSRRFSP